MQLSVIEVIGIIGIVLVVSTGKILDPVRVFLQSFENPWNPIRWFVSIISCSMCSGALIGMAWGWAHGWSLSDVIVFGGLLGILSFTSDEVLGFVGILTLRVSRGVEMASAGSSAVSLAAARRQLKPRRVGPGNDLSEEEANELADQDQAQSDAMTTPPSIT